MKLLFLCTLIYGMSLKFCVQLSSWFNNSCMSIVRRWENSILHLRRQMIRTAIKQIISSDLFKDDVKTTVTLINFLDFFFPDSFSQQVGIIWSKKMLTGTSWTTYLVVIEWCNDLIMCPNWWTIQQCVCQEEHLLLVYSLIDLFLEHKCKGGCLMTWITIHKRRSYTCSFVYLFVKNKSAINSK